ncbi:hypothetical protein SO802_028357 [Lithocarpus litseifolius]|uniref:Uncharacterized protein n=1 Tax=Lithocarpus litseifolius TaxID=425828 RepID=A0AAW2BR26_9ROSI
MVDFDFIKKETPFVSFFFARLGVFLESSGRRRPHDGLFVPQDYGAFRPILISLYLLLRQSLIAHHLEMTAIEYRDSDVWSSELETDLLSSGESANKDFEIILSKPPSSSKPSSSSKPPSSSKIPSSSIPFHALSESCLLESRHLKSIRKRFQFQEGVAIRLPRPNDKVCTFAHGKVSFYEAAFSCGLHFPTADRPLLEERYQGRIKATLEFSLIVDNFDELVDPRRLYECCLRPEPSAYVLGKIAQEEKSRFLILHPFLFYLIEFHRTNLLFADMATRYSKNKYARVKNLKNEPLDQRNVSWMKGRTRLLPLSLFGTPSSLTPSLEMITFSPPTTRFKGKANVGKSVWDDPATALGQAYNVITDDELMGLSSSLSHELVSRHIHKLVLGESLHLMTDYLNNEEKVVVANSKVDSIEVESSKLRKDLIEAMDQSTKAKEKVIELKEALKFEKKLVLQKDKEFERYFKGFELLRRWMLKHHSHVADFKNLDFEAIDTKILTDEANEKECETIAEAIDVVEGEGDTTRGATDKAQTEAGHVEEIVSAP